LIVIIGLLIGIAIGLFSNVDIPVAYSAYMSVAIFACLDSIFGAIRASLEKTYRSDVFISGFFGNAGLAVVLVYFGDKLGLPVYIAGVIVFCNRIFNNFGFIRRLLLDKFKVH